MSIQFTEAIIGLILLGIALTIATIVCGAIGGCIHERMVSNELGEMQESKYDDKQ